MLKQPKTEIKIAGAGPSGLTAAICLAKGGYPVALHEAKETVGARFIGDFQVLENGSGHPDPLMMLNDLGIAVNFFVQPIYEATLFDFRLKPTTVSSSAPFSYLIRRGTRSGMNGDISLETGLLRQAEAAGVKIYYRSRLRPEEADIIATGPTRADGLAKEMTFLTDHPNTVWVLFDMQYAPGGYAYLFVWEGQATFGCAITYDLPQINAYFEKALTRFAEIGSFVIRDEQFGYSFMDFTLQSSAAQDQRLYIGEAAGFQDYLFGLGLRYAMMTGYFAACSVMNDLSYDPLWKADLRRSQEISLINRSLYEWGGNWGLSQFIRRAGKTDFRKYLTAWQRPHPLKRLLLPIVKQVWRRDRLCRHPLPAHWCRSIRKRSAS